MIDPSHEGVVVDHGLRLHQDFGAFSQIKPATWSHWKLLKINAIYVWERLPSPIILFYTLSFLPLTHGSVLINRISSKNQQSLAYCQFFLRYQKIKCDGSNLDSFTWGFGWFSSFIYCRTPCCHCDTVKTSNFSQIQPNLAKICQNRETSVNITKKFPIDLKWNVNSLNWSSLPKLSNELRQYILWRLLGLFPGR